MIILDTNVVSALMQSAPDQQVIHWMDGTHQGLLWITAIAVYEITKGVELLPDGKRKKGLLQSFESLLQEQYHNKVIEFDANAAIAAGEMAADRKAAGHNIHPCDLQIAGIALSHGATIATRNQKYFQHLGIELINPWES